MGASLRVHQRSCFKVLWVACLASIALWPAMGAGVETLSVVNFDETSFLTDGPGTAVVYIRYGSNGGGQAAKFRVTASPGFTGMLVSEEYPGVSYWLGSVTDGLVVAYEHCFGLGYYMVELEYQLFGTSEPCSYITLTAHPEETTAVLYTCDLESVEPRIKHLWVNYDYSNGCEPPVAVEPTTWGRVKALYRN